LNPQKIVNAKNFKFPPQFYNYKRLKASPFQGGEGVMELMYFRSGTNARVIYVREPFFIEEKYEGTCEKDHNEFFYELAGGGRKIYFTKYYRIGKMDEYQLQDPFFVLYVGCFKDVFYMAIFDFNEEKYKIIYKRFVKDLPMNIDLEELLRIAKKVEA